MAISQEQLAIASDAFQADVETDPLVSQSGLNINDMQAYYTHLQDDTATTGDYQSFLSEAKNYASTDSWAKYDLDSRIVSVGFKAVYSPAVIAEESARQAGPGIMDNLSSAYDTAKNALKSGYHAAGNALSNLNPKPITDWFSTLFGWIKWIVIGAAILLVLYVVYKVAALLK